MPVSKKNSDVPVAKQPDGNGKRLGGTSGKGFMPGQSGNPTGRAKNGWTWADLIREYGEMNCPLEISKRVGINVKSKWKKVVVAAAFRHAMEGNASILKTLVEYIDGHAPLVAITNNDVKQTVIILPAIEDEEEYDPVAALREMPALLAPIPTNGNSNGNGNGNGNYHS